MADGRFTWPRKLATSRWTRSTSEASGRVAEPAVTPSTGGGALLLLDQALAVDAVACERQRLQALLGDGLVAPLARAERPVLDLLERGHDVAEDPAVTDTTTLELAVTVTDAAGGTDTATVTLPVTGASAVSAGSTHACALDDAGAAWCWGRNNEGQLGDGWDSGDLSTLPVEVVGGHTFTDIVVGGQHTCALDGDGAAWCWGGNDAGQLGDDNRGTVSPVPTAVALMFCSLTDSDASAEAATEFSISRRSGRFSAQKAASASSRSSVTRFLAAI